MDSQRPPAPDIPIPEAAGRRGAASMIPGAFEVRPARADGRVKTDAIVAPAVDGHPDAAPSRETLEHEREGGGAPSERKKARARTRFAWLRR